MNKLLLASMLSLGLFIIPNVQAQKIYAKSQNIVSPATTKQVIKELKPIFCENGESGLIKHISNCYLTSDNKDKCMLEDSVLIVLHKQMSSLFKSQTGVGLPEDGFLSDPAVAERTKIYFNPRYGSVQNAMQYFSKPGINIINNITNCPNMK